MDFKTGTLVEFRGRPWVVQQSDSEDLMMIKPLGGTDIETVGLYLPLYGDNLDIKSYNFRRPTSEDIGKYSYKSAARILYNACRLSFRDIAGPFQCLGRLSFEPRPYQMVPLILALKQEYIRLLISDDVGIGKTLESLLIAKELLDRKEIRRFAVICLPHLCEQWQNEIKDKFGLDAEIIRSSTVSRLEKKLRPDQNIFRDIPFQVISIDFVKQDNRRHVFLDHCPEFVIVDEAHTCAKPVGANRYQQQRYRLLKDISEKEGQQMVLLTATPHSGQTEEFQSLIGLLNPKFEQFTLETAKEREELSQYFVQRRRADIKQYLGNEVVFPERIQIDNDEYSYSQAYLHLLENLIDYIKNGIRLVKNEDKRKQRYIYWDLLALMRGVMSSPDAGISMLQNKIDKKSDSSSESTEEISDERIYKFNDQLKDLLNADDITPEALEKATTSDKHKFKEFITILEDIKKKDDDEKVKQALEVVKFSLDTPMNPIVFCQYIQTAEYVGKYITERLSRERKYKKVVVEIVTSRLSDEERKIKIEELSRTEQHVLVCTDCLSEGVNLQQGFETVIHYDLPWNPNRMEQRNGRIDRFGQTSQSVFISTLHSKNNPVDDIVLNILYKKQDEIRKRLGVYLPIADNDASLMETIMQRLMESKVSTQQYSQPTLFDDDPSWMAQQEKEHEIKLKKMEENEKISHTYFAHNNRQMDPSRLTGSLNEAKSVIGGIEDTCAFVIDQLLNSEVNVKCDSPLCYSFSLLGLPANLRHYFTQVATKDGTVRISFASPTPKHYMYIGRNHIFVEDLSRAVVNDSINGGVHAACRAMVMETESVSVRTTILMMRVRSVICDKKQTDKELVGEEMIFIGYKGDINNHDFLSNEDARKLFLESEASGSIDILSQKMTFNRAIEWTNDEATLRSHTDDIALQRASLLVSSFTQYRSYINSNEYQVVKPVLPMDVIAAYVFLPKI